MHKLDIFETVGALVIELCSGKFEITDPSKYTLATLEGVGLHESRKLIHYGLGCRFSSWELQVIRKTDVLEPPLLHDPDLTWITVPVGTLNRAEIASLVIYLDNKIATSNSELVGFACFCFCDVLRMHFITSCYIG